MTPNRQACLLHKNRNEIFKIFAMIVVLAVLCGLVGLFLYYEVWDYTQVTKIHYSNQITTCESDSFTGRQSGILLTHSLRNIELGDICIDNYGNLYRDNQVIGNNVEIDSKLLYTDEIFYPYILLFAVYRLDTFSQKYYYDFYVINHENTIVDSFSIEQKKPISLIYTRYGKKGFPGTCMTCVKETVQFKFDRLLFTKTYETGARGILNTVEI